MRCSIFLLGGLLLANPQDRLESLKAAAGRATDAATRIDVLREAGRAWDAGEITSAQLAGFAAHLAGLKPCLPVESLIREIERGLMLPCADLLADHLADPDPAVRRRAAEALGRVGAAAHAPALEPLLEDSDTEIAAIAAESLILIGPSDRAAKAIVGLLSSIRIEGAALARLIDAASLLEGPEAADAVRGQAASKDMSARSAALRALARMARRLPLERVFPLLKDADPAIRKAAVVALARRGAVTAAEALVPLLRDPDVPVRGATVEALGNLRAASCSADVAALLEASQPEEIRLKAAAALGEMCALERAGELLAVLKGPNAQVRLAAANALMTMDARDRMKEMFEILMSTRGGFGEAMVNAVAIYRPVESMRFLVERLDEERQRRTVLWVLGLCRGGWRFSEPLVRMLKEENRGARVSALEALSRMCVRDAAPEVVPFLKDGEDRVRELAAEALGRMGQRAAIPDLLPLLKDPQPRMRELAVIALERLGAEEHAGDIARLVEDGNAWVRAEACRALGRLGGPAASGALTKGLGDMVWWVRIRALEGLALLDDPAAEKTVASMMEDSHPQVRDSAVEALGRLGAEGRLSALLGPGGSQEPSIRFRAVEGLAWMDAPGLFDRCIPMLEEEDSRVRAAVTAALLHVGTPKDAPKAAAMLRSNVVGTRAAAVEVLCRIGAKESAPTLAGLMTDPDETVATAAILGVGRLGADRCLPKILLLRRSPQGAIRAAAAGAIGRLGSRDHLPALEPLLHDDDEQVLAETMRSWALLGGPLEKLNDVLPRLAEAGRIGFAEAVGLCGDPAAAARVLGLLKDPRSRVREAAVSAILGLRATAHLPALVAMMDDSNAAVRARAALAVARLAAGPDEAVLRELRPLREDPNDDVRLAAEIALIRLGDSPKDDPGFARRVWRRVLRRPTSQWSECGPELFSAVMQASRPAEHAKAAGRGAAACGSVADLLKEGGLELRFSAGGWTGAAPPGMPDPKRRVPARPGRTAIEAIEEASSSRPGVLVGEGTLWPLWNRSAMRVLEVLMKAR